MKTLKLLLLVTLLSSCDTYMQTSGGHRHSIQGNPKFGKHQIVIHKDNPNFLVMIDSLITTHYHGLKGNMYCGWRLGTTDYKEIWIAEKSFKLNN